MTSRLLLSLVILAIASPSACPQPPTPTKSLAFSTVSVRPHGSAPGGMFGCKVDSCTAINVPLRWLILNAYNIDDEKLLIGGPSWLDSNFDITAKLDPADIPATPLTPRQLEDMLQPVLVDRFHLKIHHESRVFPVYNLTLAKGVSKLKISSPPVPGKDPPGCYIMIKSAGFRDAHNCTLTDIAQNMEHPSGRFVVDKTGLTSHYDYQFCYSNERTPEGDPNYDCPGVFAAVQEQMGLKLEPSTAPIDILVIDSVEKPSEN